MKSSSSRFFSWVILSCAVAPFLAIGCGDSEGGDGDDSSSSGDGDSSSGDGDSSGGDGDSGEATAAFCLGDKDCSDSNGVCDTARSVCVDCVGDSDCGESQICKASSCTAITSCSSTKDCGADEVCSDALEYCVECEADADCGDDQVCSENACVASCSSDKDCSDENGVCNTETSVCVDCMSETDCSDDQYCSASGTCVDDVCASDATTCSNDVLAVCNDAGSAFDRSDCALGCASDGESCETPGDCETGEEDCDCYGNGTCNAGLDCVADVCVTPGGGNGSGGSGSGSGGSGNGSGGSSGSGHFCDQAGALDDFEDGDTIFCWGYDSSTPAPLGRWGGISSVVDNPVPRGDSTKVLHLASTTNPRLSNSDFSESDGYDATGFDGVGFWALGDGEALGFGLHTTATIADEFRGFVINASDFNTGITLTGAWTYHEVWFDDLEPRGVTMTIDKADIREFQFLIGADTDVWIDDVVVIKK